MFHLAIHPWIKSWSLDKQGGGTGWCKTALLCGLLTFIAPEAPKFPDGSEQTDKELLNCWRADSRKQKKSATHPRPFP